ncbi:hypothetical protein L195_g058289, partial [Trifolium pratense]
MMSEGSDDEPPRPTNANSSMVRAPARKRVHKKIRVVYDPTFVPMPTSDELQFSDDDEERPVVVDTTGDNNGEIDGELYVEGTYDDEKETVVDRTGRFVIRPDGNG